jgi:SAM-dependent methyltransferase
MGEHGQYRRVVGAAAMGNVADHYESLLAAHYTWMFGVPFADKVAEQQALLARFGAAPRDTGIAIDLGCGSGFQAVALADLGFSRVLAVDTSRTLLDELAARRGGRPIETIEADLRALPDLVDPGRADAVVCMGDTLTHLPARADVSRLFADMAGALAPGGICVLTWRDLSAELTGTDRFIPVASDADRVMTCFLEYEPETVIVHDLIHLREGAGWTLHKSSYRKLRLPVDWVAAELRKAGLHVTHNEAAGRLWAIAATR